MMPGKADAVKGKSSSEKIQKRVLNDYMHNLHQKFLAESNFKIGRAAFYSYRPKHICPVNFASRNVFL
ncbi:hypothetical protein DPMN_128656 [Dreissena polymorpha]|uniref:Uncharacterized protein n=1 Tax=Dreissena polymorpha TaxID=45954 RepID=A0A9D4JWN6_DREPO|nr:hypothetical protein DPMN_128656 [Dreissena polymorpha]